MYSIIGGDGNTYGPVPLETLKQWLAEGRADLNTQVRVGTGPWTTLRDLPELNDGVAGDAPPPGRTSPPPVPIVITAPPAATPGVPETPAQSTGLSTQTSAEWGPAPENYQTHAIVVTVLSALCCNIFALPFAIVSLVFANGVTSRWKLGDIHGAHASAKKAKVFFWIALALIILGLAANVFLFNFDMGTTDIEPWEGSGLEP